MQKIVPKKNVHYRGVSPAFTLLETILSITIILSISSLIPLFFQCYNKTIQLSNVDKTTEWQLFLIQMRLEWTQAYNIEVEKEKLSFQVDDNQITYTKFNDLLRRQLNGKGHEPLLTKIKDWQFVRKENQLILKVVFSDSTTYSSRFPLPRTKEQP
ncbi:ComGF family competence protein [Listeria seeligeri]|uniref:competence type IV pilus minor pilin ComGF n=1 Tax=Listeria seeligeri TaxID=1640 RepID=UPI001627BD0E|nr:competence type IV pilus minor pilin ComGF [Listeria seeligeri]MBC1763601.1 ComGF family competence protein [Listeria seeligeri]MBC1882130.1 ComGF family competence protein [Listeria seeligeri]